MKNILWKFKRITNFYSLNICQVENVLIIHIRFIMLYGILVGYFLILLLICTRRIFLIRLKRYYEMQVYNKYLTRRIDFPLQSFLNRKERIERIFMKWIFDTFYYLFVLLIWSRISVILNPFLLHLWMLTVEMLNFHPL